MMEKMHLDANVAKLKLQKFAHLSERYMLEDQLFKDFPKEVSEEEKRIAGYGADMEIAKREVATPFLREEELTEKLKRLDELNAELNMDKPENELVDGERDGDAPFRIERKTPGKSRNYTRYQRSGRAINSKRRRILSVYTEKYSKAH